VRLDKMEALLGRLKALDDLTKGAA
jgi:hypothetical protein